MSIFYDLSLSETQLEPETQKERIAAALSLGYDGIAFPHQAAARLSNADRCGIRRLGLEELLAATRGSPSPPPPPKGTPQRGNVYKLVQLTRLNIPVDDTNEAQAACSSAAVLGSFDLVAVQPQSERAFAFACTSLDVDIISVDLSRRLNFRFRPDLVKAAIQRGLQFEIFYAPMLREPGSRRQFFANAQALSRETKGRGIILSSGARTALELRGPYDVANLATFLGLSDVQAQAAVGKNPGATVQRARQRKAYRGTSMIRVS